MISTNPTTSPLHHSHAVDEAVLAYVQWREECMTVWEAYSRWTNTAADDKVPAQTAYWAALDREEAAAGLYANLLRRVGDVLEDEPVAPHPQPKGWGMDEPRGAV